MTRFAFHPVVHSGARGFPSLEMQPIFIVEFR